MAQRSLMTVGSVHGGVQKVLEDRGKGVKRAVYVHVQAPGTHTAFFAHEAESLRALDPAGNTNGIPVGQNGATSPFTFFDWEGPMWAVAAADSTLVVIEEGFA